VTYHPFRNLGLKALSVVLASLLWYTVSRDQTVERTVRVPLEYQNIPGGLEIVGDPPAAVDVRVRGASSVLGRLQPGEVVSVLDLKGARPGQRMFHLITDEVRAPFGVQVAQVTPPTVTLEFERSGVKRVPVRVSVTGDPAPGFVVGESRVQPPSVEVVGPESRLEALAEAVTEPVSVDGARGTVKDQVTIGVPDGALRLRDPQSASVAVDIAAAPVERTVDNVPVHVSNTRRGRVFLVVPDSVSVVVRGPKDAVARIGPPALRVFVDAASLGPGRYTLPVKAEPSLGYAIVRTVPDAVQVRVR
jgi:YbbR domain-containing protein